MGIRHLGRGFKGRCYTAAADKSGSQSPTLSEQMADPPGLAAVERVKQQGMYAKRSFCGFKAPYTVAADKSGSQLSEKIADPPNEGTADAAKIKEPDVAAGMSLHKSCFDGHLFVHFQN